MGGIVHGVQIVGVVLAAGRSERMGRAKALLDLGGQSFLEAVLAAMWRAGVEERVVVGGPNARALQSRVPSGVEMVSVGTGPHPIDSIRAALPRAERAEGILVWPVDHPHVTWRTAAALASAFREHGAAVVAPSINGRRGHPMIWGRATWEALRHDPTGDRGGARAVARLFQVLHVIVNDEAVVEDINTPAAYERLLERMRVRKP